MKNFFWLLIALCLLFALPACGGNVQNVELAEWAPSELYTDEEIEDAVSVVKNYFRAEFSGCTLTHVRYPGDEAAAEFEEWAAQYEADEAIVLYSSFDVDASGGDGSLNPNSTYTNWKWVLIRNDGGRWEHKTHGYG